MLEGMHFAIGPTIAARRAALIAIGGFNRLKDYLAEDFVMGKFAAEAGFGVILSSYVIEHHIGGGDWRDIASHRLRWVRSTRRSRPLGYIGQLFTMTLPLALMVCAAAPEWWPAAMAAVMLRITSAYCRVPGGAGADRLAAAAGGRYGRVSVLDGGIFRKHHRLARTAVSRPRRRPV